MIVKLYRCWIIANYSIQKIMNVEEFKLNNIEKAVPVRQPKIRDGFIVANVNTDDEMETEDNERGERRAEEGSGEGSNVVSDLAFGHHSGHQYETATGMSSYSITYISILF